MVPTHAVSSDSDLSLAQIELQPKATEGALDVFITFRFGEAHKEALALKAALQKKGITVFLSDTNAGDDLGKIIAEALRGCTFSRPLQVPLPRDLS